MSPPFGTWGDMFAGVDAKTIGRAAVQIAKQVGGQAKARMRASRRGPGKLATRTLRIAIGRISQETNALSPLPTTMKDFRTVHLREGADLIEACEWKSNEVPGFMRNAELSGFVDGVRAAAYTRNVDTEIIPLMSAWASPSGPLTRECFDELVERMVAPLRNEKNIDAVLLSLHGAMGVHDLPLPDAESPESEIVRRVRELVPNAVIGLSLDLHGNIVRGLIERAQIIQAYRTNPHRDHAAVGQKVGELVVRTLLGEVRPVTAWRSLPMILGGSPTIDFLAPLRALFRRMDQMEESGTVLAASLMTCHPWNWHAELGWAAVVTTDDDKALADECAEELAEMSWSVRHLQPRAFVTPEEAIAEARAATFARRLGVCVFADASDVVSAGAPGDNTQFLRVLIKQAQGMRTYAAIRDPEVVDMLWNEKRVGDQVSVSVGGKLDPARVPSLQIEGELISMPRSHGVERMAVVRVGTVFVVIVEGPALVISPAFYENAGLRVRKADIAVVKNFFPFLMFFAPYLRMVRFVRTRGVTDFDASNTLTFRGPTHPRDHVSDWREADTRRRGLPL